MATKGEWKVFSQVLGGEHQYIVGRVLDTSKVTHSGNIEYQGGYTPYKEAAQMLAAKLNSDCDCTKLQPNGPCEICLDCGETTGCA